ncbi:MAG: MoaD/ThiS family protein [Candidatus Brocadiia bacterium]|jgi:molybdopterin converting factor small subunit|nr:MoaD/ThiS family protein [Candidatus Brocadiia bacterium]
MARVQFSRVLAQHTGGEEYVEIDARRVVDLVEALCERFPGLGGEIDRMAVAIDDDVHGDAAYLRLEDDSEIHFVPRLRGG